MRTCYLCQRRAAAIWKDCDYCWNCLTLILVGADVIRLIPQTPNPEREVFISLPDPMAPGPH